MSIKIMSAVWESGLNDQGGLLVMLALADWCNDAGECWPSMASVARRARLSDERSARRIVARLREAGWIEIDIGGGRHGCNKYTLKLGPKVPQDQKTPRTLEPAPPGLSMPKTRTLEPAEPSRTIIEPSKSNKGRAEKKPDDVSQALLAWASPQSVESFIAYRKRHKAKALTPTGAKRLAGHLQEIFNAGGDCNDALAMIEEKGWASIEPDWYFRAKGTANNGRPAKPSVDRTLLQIADGLTSGAVRLDYSSRDPFAAR